MPKRAKASAAGPTPSKAPPNPICGDYWARQTTPSQKFVRKYNSFGHVYIMCPGAPGSPEDAFTYLQHPALVRDSSGYVHTVNDKGDSARASNEWLAIPDPDSDSVHYFWSVISNRVQWEVPLQCVSTVLQ